MASNKIFSLWINLSVFSVSVSSFQIEWQIHFSDSQNQIIPSNISTNDPGTWSIQFTKNMNRENMNRENLHVGELEPGTV